MEPNSQRGQKGGSSICKCFLKKGTPGFPGNRAREVLVGPMERRVRRVLTVQKQNVASHEFYTGTNKVINRYNTVTLDNLTGILPLNYGEKRI